MRCSRLVSVIVHFSGLSARSAPSPLFCSFFCCCLWLQIRNNHSSSGLMILKKKSLHLQITALKEKIKVLESRLLVECEIKAAHNICRVNKARTTTFQSERNGLRIPPAIFCHNSITKSLKTCLLVRFKSYKKTNPFDQLLLLHRTFITTKMHFAVILK